MRLNVRGIRTTVILLMVVAAIYVADYQFIHFLSEYLTLVFMALIYVLATSCYRYTKSDYSLFIGNSLLVVGIIKLIQIFYLHHGLNYFHSVKSMVDTGVFLLEAVTLACAPFFTRRKFSGIFFAMLIIMVGILDISMNWYFGFIIPKNIVSYGCGIILLMGLGNLVIHHRNLNDSIYYKMVGATVLLAIVSFLRIEVLIDTFIYPPELFRLGAYILIYLGPISVPYESIFHEFKKSALIDELTGLYNRHGLMEFAKKEIARADREGWFVGVLLMDLDRFKNINDRHGHLAGDRIIKQFANILKGSIRETDIICRLGGDEFVVMLSSEDSNLSPIRERILEAVGKWKLTDELAAKIGVSIGIGIKEPGVHKKLEEILKEADLYMYREKYRKKAVKKVEESSQYKIFG